MSEYRLNDEVGVEWCKTKPGDCVRVTLEGEDADGHTISCCSFEWFGHSRGSANNMQMDIVMSLVAMIRNYVDTGNTPESRAG